MKLHLPLNLLLFLMSSFSGVTLGTATFVGFSGILAAASQSSAADAAFNGALADAEESASPGLNIMNVARAGDAAPAWDPAWGIADLPAFPAATEITGDVQSLYTPGSLVENFGSVHVVEGTGDRTGVTLAGGYYNSATNTPATAITSGIWTDVRGGDYKLIIGGSYANNWEGSGKWDVTGDIHTQIQGNTSVNWVVGGNYKDGQSAAVTGDIYVSVGGDAVINGSLIGGGTAAHNVTNIINGSTHVVVRGMQSVTKENINLYDRFNVANGFIIGGSAYESNAASGGTISGSTNVTIDLGNASGNFVKSIVGGSHAGGEGTSTTGNFTIGGDTNVTITASSNAVFKGAIYGGSYAGGGGTGTATVGGNSTLTLDGGTYEGALYAGGGGAKSVVSGNASLIVKNAVFRTGSTLKVSEGAVNGASTLVLGGDADSSIAFSNTEIGAFDIVKMFQGAMFSGNMTMQGSSKLALEGGAGSGISLNGTFSLAQSGALKLDLTQFGALTDGMNVLTSSGLENITRIDAVFADDISGKIVLSNDGNSLVFQEAHLIKWQGGASGNWSAANIWTDKTGTAATYQPNDAVSFSDQAGVASATVVLDAVVSPFSLEFNNSGTNYIFSSQNDGTIEGSGTLTKKGSGMVEMKVSNAGFNGNVFLNEGGLVASADHAFGTGSMSFNGGVLYLGADNVLIANELAGSVKIGVEGADTVYQWNAGNASKLGGEGAVAFTKVGDGTLKIDHAAETTYTNAIVIESGAIQFAGASGSPVLLNNSISGAGDIIKTGNSDLRIMGNASIGISGNIVLKDGAKLNLTDAAATLSLGTGAVVLDKGEILMGNKDLTLSTRVEMKDDSVITNNGGGKTLTLNGGLDIASGKTLTFKTDYKNGLVVNGISGGGDLMLQRPTNGSQYDGWRRITISGDGSGFTGTVTMDGSDFNGTSAFRNYLFLRSDNALVNGKVVMASNAQDLAIDTDNAHIAGVSGTGVIGAYGNAERALTWRADEDQTFEGIVADNIRKVEGGAVVYDTGSKLSLTKTGAGKLTLSGANTYTGLTTIEAGELAFTHAGGMTLAGGLTMAANTRMSTAGALNITTESTLTLDISSAITATGAFGAGTFTLTLNGLEGITDAGEYTLITAGSGLDSTSAIFNWAGYEGDGTLLYELQQTDTMLKLLVTSAANVWIWQGTSGLAWSDTSTGAEWGISGSSETAAGKNLVFNDTGAGTVTISGEVTPASIKVNNTEGKDYEFTTEDGGKIAAGTLTKLGAGALTMNLDNTDWTGAISIQQGELVAKVAHSLGSGAITIEGGTLTLATGDVQDGMGVITLKRGSLHLAEGAFGTEFTTTNMTWTEGSLVLGEGVTASAAKTLANGKTVELGNNSVLTVSGTSDNTALALNASGTGTVSVALGGTYGSNILNMSTAFQGTLAVTAGNFQLNKVTMGADAVLKLADSGVGVEWNGDAEGTFANDIVFAGNQMHASKDFTLSGKLSGTAFDKQAVGNLTLTGTVNLDGQLKVSNGTLTVNSAAVTKLGDSIDISGNSKLAFAQSFSYAGVISGTAGSTLAVNSGTLELTGANTFLGALSIAGGATARLGDGGSWAGSISGEGSLVIDTTGNVTLAGGNTDFSGSTTLSGTGTVTLTDASSLGSGKVTVNNGTLDLASQSAANAILITKGNLKNAEAKTTGNVEIAASAGTEGSLNTISLGGLSGSLVQSIVMEDFTRLTGINGPLDMTGKTVTLKLDSGSLTAGGSTGAGVIDADSLTLSAATTTINLSNQAVLDLLAANRASLDGVGLVLTTGTLSVDNYKKIDFSPLLTSLGYAVTGVANGTLTVSGNTDLEYLVNDKPGSDESSISNYATLDPYKMVGVDGTSLHVSLNGAPDASRNGDGLKVSNLVGSNAALVVTNTAANAAENHAVVDLVQNIDAGSNSYGGTISGDHVDFIKKGTEILTVEGNFTGNGSVLSSTEGKIVLNGAANSLSTLDLSGGDITLGGRNDGAARTTTVETLSSGTGGGTLDLGRGARLVVTGQAAGSHVTDVTISGDGTLTLGGEGMASSLTLGNGSSLDGVLLDIREGSALSTATGSMNNVSGLSGGGALTLNGTTMTISSGASHIFTGTLEGDSGTLNIKSAAANVKSGNGSVQTIQGAGNAGYNLNVSDGGALTLAGAAAGSGDPATASYKGITVNGGTLNIGSTDVPRTQLTLGTDGLRVTGNSTVTITTSSSTVNGLGAPFVTSSGGITLGDGTGEVTLVMSNLDTLVSGSTETLNLELFKTTGGALVSLGDNVTLQDMILSSLYDNLSLTTNDSMTAIIVTGTARTENIFRDSAETRNAGTGADILWNSRYNMPEGSPLRDLYTSILTSQNSGDYSGASRKLAAAAGSTVTSLGIAQRDSLRDQMLWVRNRVAQMGVNPSYVNADLPYFHMWLQGTGSYAKLDTKGDESGYKLTTWGGTVGMDVDINDRFTLGAAFTANYGSLSASAADTADGDLDSYYVNLFGRYQSRNWSHLLILTGGWNDAKLTRTVDYGTGSYQAHGSTTGAGFGAMYELAYDIALNEDKSVVLQPLFNASIVTTRMDGYSESGSAGNAGLRVEDQELTTAAVAVGARLSGLIGSNIFGREALGEVRVNVSQDMGDRRGQANVGFLSDPGYTRPVYGAKVGSTAFQAGVGLSVPVGYQGVIFVEGNADIRSGSSSINGSIGYRYNF